MKINALLIAGLTGLFLVSTNVSAMEEKRALAMQRRQVEEARYLQNKGMGVRTQVVEQPKVIEQKQPTAISGDNEASVSIINSMDATRTVNQVLYEGEEHWVNKDITRKSLAVGEKLEVTVEPGRPFFVSGGKGTDTARNGSQFFRTDYFTLKNGEKLVVVLSGSVRNGPITWSVSKIDEFGVPHMFTNAFGLPSMFTMSQ